MTKIIESVFKMIHFSKLPFFVVTVWFRDRLFQRVGRKNYVEFEGSILLPLQALSASHTSCLEFLPFDTIQNRNIKYKAKMIE